MPNRLTSGQGVMLGLIDADVNLNSKAYLTIQNPLPGEVLESQFVALYVYGATTYTWYYSHLLPDGTYVADDTDTDIPYSSLPTQLKDIPFNSTSLYLNQADYSDVITAIGHTPP